MLDTRMDPDCCDICGHWLSYGPLQPGMKVHRDCWLDLMAEQDAEDWEEWLDEREGVAVVDLF